ncbi:MAG: FG-GAP-like repeat-containing protein [Thermoanaerobaculia bacterium]
MFRIQAAGRSLRFSIVGVAWVGFAAPASAALTFTKVVIDASNPTNPHCKTLGDIDGDGFLDALAASSNGAGMFWYEYPAWTKHTIRATGSWTTDMQAGDVDGDGDLDVVIPDGSALKWYENPRPGLDPRPATWTEHTIGGAGANHHDVELADMEPDGDLDVVSRKKNGNDTSFWRQGPANVWTRVSLPSGTGEGTALGDLDGDGDLDVAHNGFWIRQVTPTSWTSHTIDATFVDDTGVTIADVDGNGDNDVILGPSESAGKLSWYEAIDPVNGPWTEHSIDASVTFLHTFKAADMDHDGDLDLVTAEMHQSSNPDEVSVYFNDGEGTTWSQQVVAESGSHNLRVGDIGGDGDLDLFGANWNDGAPNSAVIEMWENTTSPLALGSWNRHIVETSLPWNAVFVDGKDLNGDGLPDLVTGGWWYPNPGALGGTWTRQTIGAPLNNMAVVHDFDNDGDFDILGTDGQVGGEDFSWARNDGAGTFTNFDITNTATAGDFLQGVSLSQLIVGSGGGGQEEVVLSWHNGGSGTAMLSVPDDPTTTAWPLTVLSATTNQEQVPLGDLDGDGDLDVHLGTSWLRQDAGGAFSTQSGISLSGGGVPDRVALADVDADGDLDVVIGVEFASTLVWGENDGSGGTWTEHGIATDFDYFSVDVGDLDGDGDVDVVGGAHKGSGEVSIYANNGSGTAWTSHVVDSGTSAAIDHHDGTILVDMDLDRDLDIISVGWTKKSLVIYENLAIDDGPTIDSTPPTVVSVSALGTATEVVVDFSEPLETTSAENTSDYAISDEVTVSAAELAANQHSVTLTTSTLAAGTGYTLTIDGVQDLAGNSIATGTTAMFGLGAGDPTAGLVARWPFDEGAGLVALDASGNGNTGFLINGTLRMPEASGGSLAFDGIDDYVDAGSFDVSGSALTLAAWIYPENLSNCSSHDCRVFSKSTGTAEADHYFMLSTISSEGGTRLRFRLKSGGTTTTLIASDGDLAENLWVHAAAVYDGATMRLFLNGAEVGETAKSGAIRANPGVPVWIGGNPIEPASKPWKGKIDDVRVYDRALSFAELAALPPPSVDWIFADGFESGSISAWSEHAGFVQVLGAASRVRTLGLRAQAGTTCASADFEAITPPPTTIQGVREACRELTAEGVEVEPPGATLRAGELVGLGAGFGVSGDLTVEVDPTLTPFAWVRDESPEGEAIYAAELDLRLDALTLGPTDRLELLVGLSDTEEVTFRLVLQSDGGGGHEAFLEARRDDGSFATTPSGQEAAITAGWHRLRLEWKAAAGTGSLALTIDGAASGALSGLANGTRRIDAVAIGAVDGSLAGAAGSVDLDSFSSWR